MSNSQGMMSEIFPTSKHSSYRVVRVFVMQGKRQVVRENLTITQAIDHHVSTEGCSRTAQRTENVLCTIANGFWYDDYERMPGDVRK